MKSASYEMEVSPNRIALRSKQYEKYYESTRFIGIANYCQYVQLNMIKLEEYKMNLSFYASSDVQTSLDAAIKTGACFTACCRCYFLDSKIEDQ